MKKNRLKISKLYQVLIFPVLIIAFTSCTSTQGMYSEADGIYVSTPNEVVVINEEPSTNYQRYFETEAQNIYIGPDDIVTDVDDYVGYDETEGEVVIINNYTNGNPPFGYVDSNVSVNFYGGFGGAWGNPYYGFYDPWMWNYASWYGNPWYGYGGGWYGGWYGGGWGYPWYGGGWYGGGYYPPYYRPPYYRPPYYGGTYGKRNGYPVRSSSNGYYSRNSSRNGDYASATSNARPNIYRNSTRNSSGISNSTYQRNSSSRVNSSARSNGNYNNNSNVRTRPSYTPSSRSSSGYSRGSSSRGSSMSRGSGRNGPNTVYVNPTDNEQNVKGTPVKYEIIKGNNFVLNRNNSVSNSNVDHYVWKNGKATRVSLNSEETKRIVNDYQAAISRTNNQNVNGDRYAGTRAINHNQVSQNGRNVSTTQNSKNYSRSNNSATSNKSYSRSSGSSGPSGVSRSSNTRSDSSSSSRSSGARVSSKK